MLDVLPFCRWELNTPAWCLFILPLAQHIVSSPALQGFDRWDGHILMGHFFMFIHSLNQSQEINYQLTTFFPFISAYPAHGYPSNSSYPNQGSWYSYPANGYAGGYSAYPGPSGYWSNASDAPSSHSNMSANPKPSQTMVQYPVCPRQPHSYLVQVNIRKQHLLIFEKSCQP